MPVSAVTENDLTRAVWATEGAWQHEVARAVFERQSQPQNGDEPGSYFEAFAS